MHFKLFKYLIFTLIVLSPLLFSIKALADVDEIYHLSIGTNFSIFDTDISLRSNDDSIGSDIDLEDDLNYAKNVNTAWISGWYRVGDNHRLKLTYVPIRRTSSIESTNDIIIDDSTLKAGAIISSSTRTDIFDFSYIYSLYKAPQLEVGLSAGIYWLLTDTKVFAAGNIQIEGDDQPIFKSDYFTQQKLQAPMPLFGLAVNYEFSNHWRTHAALRYLSLQVNDIKGELLSADLAIEYYFNDNWGMGISVSTFSLDVSTENIISNASLKWSQDAAQIYAVFKY